MSCATRKHSSISYFVFTNLWLVKRQFLKEKKRRDDKIKSSKTATAGNAVVTSVYTLVCVMHVDRCTDIETVGVVNLLHIRIRVAVLAMSKNMQLELKGSSPIDLNRFPTG